jgi:hypothetical protein
MPWAESSTMDIIMNGVMAANFAAITELPLKRLAQRPWRKPSSRMKERPRNTDSFNVTATAFFALTMFPAPISFDTLVLQKVQEKEHKIPLILHTKKLVLTATEEEIGSLKPDSTSRTSQRH